MASYFFETSALAKRYIQESGSSWVSGVCEKTAGHLIFIADITEVELVSAILRRGKGGSLTLAEIGPTVKQFDADARILVESYALRGYDAVQLALAIGCNQQRILLGLPGVIFASSDTELIDAALSEGLTVENPNDHLR